MHKIDAGIVSGLLSLTGGLGGGGALLLISKEILIYFIIVIVLGHCKSEKINSANSEDDK